MTEHEREALWREGTDPLALLDDLYPPRTLGSEKPQDRKCRLYLCACARRQWDRLPGVCRALVELAEYVAESPREREEVRAAVAAVAERLMHSAGEEDDLSITSADLEYAARSTPPSGPRAVRRGVRRGRLRTFIRP
jgi:hypothetical protein